MIKKYGCALSILLVLIQFTSGAEVLVLPDQLSEIAEESFYADSSIVECVVPKNVTAIDDRAFSGCENLGWITIPENTERFGEDVFTGCANDLLIRTVARSPASAYARDHSIDYQAGTTYRSLLIGQTYAQDPELQLDGPENDIIAFNTCLTSFSGTPYHVTTRMNVSAGDMLSAIDEIFGSATVDDVSLFFYSGHGVSSTEDEVRGALLGVNGEDYVSANQLRSALDKIPGRKIVIIDACYSGNLITLNKKDAKTKTVKSMSSLSEALSVSVDDFTSAFISAFSVKKRGVVASDSYFILTAAASDEESYEEELQGRVMGLFTYYMTNGLGYLFDGNRADDLPIDVNENGVITLQEMYQYTRKQLIPEGQHVQVYPQNCLWFGLLRNH